MGGPKQTTFCFCPSCGLELCGSYDVIVSDTDLVRYVCTCLIESTWDFDAPLPLLVAWGEP